MSDPNEHPVMEQVRFLRDLADRVEALPTGYGYGVGATDAYRLRTISYALEFMFTASTRDDWTSPPTREELNSLSVPENVRINALDEKGRRIKPAGPDWEKNLPPFPDSLGDDT